MFFSVELAIIASCLLSPVAMGLVSPIGTVEAEIPIPEKIEEDVESVEGESGKEEAIPKTIKEEVFYFRGYWFVS